MSGATPAGARAPQSPSGDNTPGSPRSNSNNLALPAGNTLPGQPPQSISGATSPHPSSSASGTSTAPAAVTVPAVTTSLGRRTGPPTTSAKKPGSNLNQSGVLPAQRSSMGAGDFVTGGEPILSPVTGQPPGVFSPVNQFPTTVQPPSRKVDSWTVVFALAKFSDADSKKYAQLFEANQMPPPSNAESLRLFLDNQFLSSIGIELAGHRAKILVQVRQLLGTSAVSAAGPTAVYPPTSPRSRSRTVPGPFANGGGVVQGAHHHASNHHGLAGMPSHETPSAGGHLGPRKSPPPPTIVATACPSPAASASPSGPPPPNASMVREHGRPKSPRPHRLQLYCAEYREAGDILDSEGDSDEERGPKENTDNRTHVFMPSERTESGVYGENLDAPLLASEDPGRGGGQLPIEAGNPHHHQGGPTILSGAAIDATGTRTSDGYNSVNQQYQLQNDSIVTTGEYNSVKLDAMRYAQVTSDQLQCEDKVVVNTFKSSPSSQHRPFTWIDVSGRDRDRTQFKKALMDLTTRYGFSESLLLDMDLSVALPQVLTSQEDANQYVVILRVATEFTDIEEDSLHELTNRWMVAVNVENHTIATIHRMDSFPLAKLRLGWQEYDVDLLSFHGFVCKIFDDSIVAYIDALQESEFLLDKYEGVMLKHSVGAGEDNSIAAMTNVPGGYKKKRGKNKGKHKSQSGWFTGKVRNFFGAKQNPAESARVAAHLEATANFGSLTTRSRANVLPLLLLEEQNQLTKQRMNQLLYHLHRRCSVYSRMLSLTQAALESAYSSIRICSAEYAEQMSRSCGELALKAEGLHDNCQNLLNLHLSLVSFRTNELMNILTVFSAFFIPLTFISGVYGMNFVNMPELNLYYGYYGCLTGMLIITTLVFIFFRSKGLI